MKVVIFAGGRGTRLSEETNVKPKPMVEIGGQPIIWHIMKHYAKYGHTDFIICLGYMGHVIRDWFFHYSLYNSNVTIDLSTGNLEVHSQRIEPWKVTLVDTGLDTSTATRLQLVREYVGNDTFMMTYGDGVGDVDLDAALVAHKQHKKHATVTVSKPEGRFGAVHLDEDNMVSHFAEKFDQRDVWVNSGFFILEPEVFSYIPTQDVMWERAPMEQLTADGQLYAYKHEGFWKPMDTLRDRHALEVLWESGAAPWKTWA